jgi:hypothetical protein
LSNFFRQLCCENILKIITSIPEARNEEDKKKKAWPVKKIGAGLPDGLFSNQKSKVG